MAVLGERSKRITTKQEFKDKITDENLRILDRYLMYKDQEGRSPKSIYNYKMDIIHFMSWLAEFNYRMNVVDVQEEDLEDYLYMCKKGINGNKGNNESRIRRRMSSLSTLFIFMRRKKMIDTNPIEFIPRPQKGDDIVEHIFLTQEQVDKIREELVNKEEVQLMTYFVVSLSTMGRVGAISQLSWKSYDKDNKVFKDVVEKGRKVVKLFLTDEAIYWLETLKKYREENNIEDNGWVFLTTHGNNPSESTCNSWAKSIGEIVDEPNLHTHSFRKSGSQLRNLGGMNMETLQMLLNHNDISTTQKFYTQRNDEKLMKEFENIKI